MAINLGSTAIADAKLGDTQVDKIYLGSTEIWSKAVPTIKALKFTSADAQTLGIDTSKLGSYLTPYFEYSLDNGSTWSVWDITTTISFGNGVDLYLRGTNQRLGYAPQALSNWTNFVFSTSSPVYCSGNVMHLLDFTQDLDAFPLNGGVGRLFYGCTQLVTAPALPATTLKRVCYSGMFSECTNLETIPALPATTLANYCYEAMFYGCSKIKISATQVDEYTNVFTFGVAPTTTQSPNMFKNTGGTFTGTPTAQTYYTSNTIVS